MLIKTLGFVGNADLPSFIRLELRVERGFMFRLSGVTSSAAKALQGRVRSALLTCGYRWPGKAITVNIASATTARSTTELDLPIALSILAALGKIPKSSIKGTAFSGELSLDGTIRYTTSSASPPGSGKSTQAQIIHSLLPDIEKGSSTLRPPWRASHSTTKPAGLIGSWRQSGGADGSINLGEWSLAHQGILFMDEWA